MPEDGERRERDQAWLAQGRHRRHAQALGVLAVFGIAMTIAGIYGLVYFIRLWWGPDRD